jgi:hypothetical protein
VIQELDEVMGAVFGHAWSSSGGGARLDVWQQSLGDLTAAQVVGGLRRVADGDVIGVEGWPDKAWPPTLPVFRALCGARPRDAHTRQYDRWREQASERALERQHLAALPAPERESREQTRKARAQAILQAELDKLRRKKREQDAALAEARKSLPPQMAVPMGVGNRIWDAYMAQFRDQQYLPGHNSPVGSWYQFQVEWFQQQAKDEITKCGIPENQQVAGGES